MSGNSDACANDIKAEMGGGDGASAHEPDYAKPERLQIEQNPRMPKRLQTQSELWSGSSIGNQLAIATA